jgi:general nucleoside transport system permease protein
VFAEWRPGRLLAGAYLFGAVMTLELHAKAAGVTILPPEVLAMLPYLATILILTLISIRPARASAAAPACLGKSFTPA